MRLTDPLNDRQLEVLRWIADGCRPGVMVGSTYKVSARALRDRRLVMVSKADDSWSAEVTETGRYYLKHGSFPPKGVLVDRPTPRRSHVKRQKSGAAPDRDPEPVTAAPSRKPSATEQLVADVVAAGGILRRLQESGRDVTYRASELVHNANRHGKTPPGTRLVHSVDYDGPGWQGSRYDLFVLEEGPAGTDAPLLPVPVPDKVGRYHPVVTVLRDTEHATFSTAVRIRAFRILHAVAIEAERRGFIVTSPSSRQSSTRDVWHMLLTLDDDTVPLRITEETDRVERKHSAWARG